MASSDGLDGYDGSLNLPGMGGGEEPPAPTPGEEELPPLTDYGQRFLQNLPENERPQAERWVREWDGGVAKMRAKHEEQLGAFTRMGPVEDIQAGVQLFRMLTGGPDDQQKISDYLAEQGITPTQAKAIADAVEKVEENPTEKRIKQLEDAVTAVGTGFNQFRQETQQQKALREYNDLLDQAETQLGKYDRKYVSYLLSTDQAKTLEEAVRMDPSFKPKSRATAPNLLGGSGSAPHHGGKKPDFGAMSEKDIGNYLVARLTAGE